MDTAPLMIMRRPMSCRIEKSGKSPVQCIHPSTFPKLCLSSDLLISVRGLMSGWNTLPVTTERSCHPTFSRCRRRLVIVGGLFFNCVGVAVTGTAHRHPVNCRSAAVRSPWPLEP